MMGSQSSGVKTSNTSGVMVIHKNTTEQILFFYSFVFNSEKVGDKASVRLNVQSNRIDLI